MPTGADETVASGQFGAASAPCQDDVKTARLTTVIPPDRRRQVSTVPVMPDRIFGDIPGNPRGTPYDDRDELAAAGVHRPLQGGIWGGRDGAESVVVSGGYVDDLDYGETVVYTGQGGRDPNTGRQIADQELIRGNLGLARSQLDGLPVRVVRGSEGDPVYSPASGYRYDGLFHVADYWHEIGRDGFRIWRFRLVAVDSLDTAAVADGETRRVKATVQRIVRNTYFAAKVVKELHDHTCQVCGLRLMTPAGAYAEAAHIRPLGAPHNGPDAIDNILCLCPNDHVLFDNGAIYIDEAGVVRECATNGEVGKLRLTESHKINPEQVRYHREHYSQVVPQ
jgi:putative restriction endonuclease